MRINPIVFKPLNKTNSDVQNRSNVNYKMRAGYGEPLELIMLKLAVDFRVAEHMELNRKLGLNIHTSGVERDEIVALRLKNAKIAELTEKLGLPEETSIQQLYEEVKKIGTSYLGSDIRIPTLREALGMPEGTTPKNLFTEFRQILVKNNLHGLIGDNF